MIRKSLLVVSLLTPLMAISVAANADHNAQHKTGVGRHSVPTEAWAQARTVRSAAATRRSRGAFALARSNNRPARLSSSAVVDGRRVIGRDPDPNVRAMIQRDWREITGGF